MKYLFTLLAVLIVMGTAVFVIDRDELPIEDLWSGSQLELFIKRTKAIDECKALQPWIDDLTHRVIKLEMQREKERN